MERSDPEECLVVVVGRGGLGVDAEIEEEVAVGWSI